MPPVLPPWTGPARVQPSPSAGFLFSHWKSVGTLPLKQGRHRAMGFRFGKSVELFPGVNLNFSKTRISASIGKPGATVNISDRGTKTTVRIPGTGISYSENSPSRTSTTSDVLPFARPHPPADSTRPNGMGFGALLGCGLVALIGFLMTSGLFK